MQEEEFAVRVGDGVAPNPHSYEAIHYSRSARGSRSSKVLAVVLGVAVGCVLLSADRYQQVAGPPAGRAVSEAAASLHMGKIHEPTKSQSLQFAGVPGMLAPPPPGGYNVFDPHYSEDGVPPDHLGGTEKGAFTGHTAGTEGGPLTFGPNTYWNVFDPNGSPDLGPCDPGTTGTAGTATKKRDCTECPIGKWCPGGSDSLANDCPPHSTTFIGSSEAEQCKCSLGWFGVAHYHETTSCKMCLADTYCPGGRTQDACPLHSSSPDEASYCSCDSSYYGITHDYCKLCEKDFFCPGGDPRGQQQFACPMNSNSAAGSDNGDDCQCNARYYEPLPDTDTEGPGILPSPLAFSLLPFIVFSLSFSLCHTFFYVSPMFPRKYYLNKTYFFKLTALSISLFLPSLSLSQSQFCFVSFALARSFFLARSRFLSRFHRLRIVPRQYILPGRTKVRSCPPLCPPMHTPKKKCTGPGVSNETLPQFSHQN